MTVEFTTFGFTVVGVKVVVGRAAIYIRQNIEHIRFEGTVYRMMGAMGGLARGHVGC